MAGRGRGGAKRQKPEVSLPRQKQIEDYRVDELPDIDLPADLGSRVEVEGSLEINRDANELCEQLRAEDDYGGMEEQGGEGEMPVLETAVDVHEPPPAIARESKQRSLGVEATLEMLVRAVGTFEEGLLEMRRENRNRAAREDQRQAAMESQIQELWSELKGKKTSTPKRRNERPPPVPRRRRAVPAESFSTIDAVHPTSSYQSSSAGTPAAPPIAVSVHTKDAPVYRAKISTADPIARNQELENC